MVHKTITKTIYDVSGFDENGCPLNITDCVRWGRLSDRELTRRERRERKNRKIYARGKKYVYLDYILEEEDVQRVGKLTGKQIVEREEEK